MQQDRGQAPYPLGLELTLLVVASVACMLVLGVHAGRAVATVIAGGGLVWPAAQDLVQSVPAVLGGDHHAGLPAADLPVHHGEPGPDVGLLRWCIGVVEVVLLALAGWCGVAALQRWGPARMKGVASREEAATILGASRLRTVRAVVRPDLYGAGAATSRKGS